MSDKPVSNTRTTGATCPICRKQAAAAFKPFCSQRCADVDLGRWLTAQYVVPGCGPETGQEDEDT